MLSPLPPMDPRLCFTSVALIELTNIFGHRCAGGSCDYRCRAVIGAILNREGFWGKHQKYEEYSIVCYFVNIDVACFKSGDTR